MKMIDSIKYNRFFMKRVLTFLLILFSTSIICLDSSAQKKEDLLNTYNYKRAIELANEHNYDEALKYFQMEIKDHKNNGYAYAMIANLQYNQDSHGDALNNIELALKNLNKKDEYYGFALGLRSDIYLALGDKVKAEADLDTYVKLFSKDAESYEKRGRHYLDEDKYELALADFQKATSLAKGESTYYIGIAVCQRNLKEKEEAIKTLDYAIKLNSQNSRAFSQRGYTYMEMREFQKAADDFVKALEIDNDDLAFNYLDEIADSSFEAIDFKLKMKQVMKPNEPSWPYYRALIRKSQKMYPEAIEMFKTCQKLNYSIVLTRNIAECYNEMGDFESSLNAINEGIESDSTDVSLIYLKAHTLDDYGRAEESIAEFTHLIELAPDAVQGYTGRAWVKQHNNDVDGAIEDYTMATMVDPSYVFSYHSRGRLYKKKGKIDLANADFKKVLELDTIPSEYSTAFYALLDLGEKEKAIAAMDSVLAKDSLEHNYDAACLYSLMGDKTKALMYLRRALENGFTHFHHISRDEDLDAIREMDEFKSLIEEFKKKNAEAISKNSSASEEATTEETIEEIPFTHEGGVTKVKCKINDLPLHFVFDTGAADVSMSTVEATFMFKNGYLSEKDIVGKQAYSTADGSIHEGTVIVLKKVTIGDFVLENIRASVVKSQKAPLLLGQSVLQRLGKIEIDNTKHVLKIRKRK